MIDDLIKIDILSEIISLFTLSPKSLHLTVAVYFGLSERFHMFQLRSGISTSWINQQNFECFQNQGQQRNCSSENQTEY